MQQPKLHEGHIGYSVRPTNQNQGYATEILYLLLEESQKIGIDEVLVTCDIENKASAKVIENNAGVLVEKITDSDWEEVAQKYSIDVKDALNKK